MTKLLLKMHFVLIAHALAFRFGLGGLPFAMFGTLVFLFMVAKLMSRITDLMIEERYGNQAQKLLEFERSLERLRAIK